MRKFEVPINSFVPEILQILTNQGVPGLGLGLFAVLNVASTGWLRKHMNILSTQFWMILIAAVMSIVMVVLFLFPIQQKFQPNKVEAI